MNEIRYAQDDKLGWKKPDWTKKAPLKASSKGVAVKAGENLAKEITKLPEHANEKRIGWEKPSWAVNGPKLRVTANAQVMKTKGNLAKPITSLPHLQRGTKTEPDNHLQKSFEDIHVSSESPVCVSNKSYRLPTKPMVEKKEDKANETSHLPKATRASSGAYTTANKQVTPVADTRTTSKDQQKTNGGHLARPVTFNHHRKSATSTFIGSVEPTLETYKAGPYKSVTVTGTAKPRAEPVGNTPMPITEVPKLATPVVHNAREPSKEKSRSGPVVSTSKRTSTAPPKLASSATNKPKLAELFAAKANPAGPMMALRHSSTQPEKSVISKSPALAPPLVHESLPTPSPVAATIEESSDLNKPKVDHPTSTVSQSKEGMLIELLVSKKSQLAQLQQQRRLQQTTPAQAPVNWERIHTVKRQPSSERPILATPAPVPPVSFSKDTPRQTISKPAFLNPIPSSIDTSGSTPVTITPAPAAMPPPQPAPVSSSVPPLLVSDHATSEPASPPTLIPESQLSPAPTAMPRPQPAPVSSSIPPPLDHATSEPTSPATLIPAGQLSPAPIPPHQPSPACSSIPPPMVSNVEASEPTSKTTLTQADHLSSVPAPIPPHPGPVPAPQLENPNGVCQSEDKHRSTFSKMFEKFKPSFMKHSKRPRRKKLELHNHANKKPLMMATVEEEVTDEDQDPATSPVSLEPACVTQSVTPPATFMPCETEFDEYEEESYYEEQTIYDEETVYDEQTVIEFEDITYVSDNFQDNSEYLYEEEIMDDDVEEVFLEGLYNVVPSSCRNDEEYEA